MNWIIDREILHRRRCSKSMTIC